MMKVSFKEDYKDVLVFQDKVTAVTLTGCMVVNLEHIPHHIWTWVLEHPSIDISVTYNNGKENWILKSGGKAKLHEGDTFDAKTGERIAECRAKIRIYRFMQTLTGMLCGHYYGLVFGCHGEAARDLYSFDGNRLYADYEKYSGLLDHERHHLVELLQEKV